MQCFSFENLSGKSRIKKSACDYYLSRIIGNYHRSDTVGKIDSLNGDGYWLLAHGIKCEIAQVNSINRGLFNWNNLISSNRIKRNFDLISRNKIVHSQTLSIL